MKRGGATSLVDKFEGNDFESPRPGNFCEYRDYGSRLAVLNVALQYIRVHGDRTRIWFCRKCASWHVESDNRETAPFELVPKGRQYDARRGSLRF